MGFPAWGTWQGSGEPQACCGHFWNTGPAIVTYTVTRSMLIPLHMETCDYENR